jgi:hypothetical protein
MSLINDNKRKPFAKTLAEKNPTEHFIVQQDFWALFVTSQQTYQT